MLFEKVPDNFNQKFKVVGNFIQCNGEIVLLHRQSHRPEGGTWEIPSGKINFNELRLAAVFRETREETGFIIPPGRIQFFKTVYIKYPDKNFSYHIFYSRMDKKSRITINPGEHQNARWITPAQALTLPLIEDLTGCIKLFFNI